MDYKAIKQLAKERGVSVTELCALAPNNDPFYTGRPAEVKAAEWFADLWQRFGYTTGVHLRRVHYRAVHPPGSVLKPDGTVYENTDTSWKYLCNAGKWARYLNLVSPTAFEDRRNPEPMIFTAWKHPDDVDYRDPAPRYGVVYDWEEWDSYSLPEIPSLPGIPYQLPDLPALGVGGYNGIQQGYHIEVWCEKTTMNDVLKPLCERYGVNLVTGAGEMSISSVVDFLLERVHQADRPARILYVSDYDPAGLGMPISVARKVEFYQRENGSGALDIRLHPIVLTSDQVGAFDLPRIPVKDSDRRKANWIEHHGAGQVELDALEALHPGELQSIVSEAILQYYDPNLVQRAQGQRYALWRALQDEQGGVLEGYEEQLKGLGMDYSRLVDDFGATRERFSELVQDFQAEINAHQEALQRIIERGRTLYDCIQCDLDDVDIDLDDYPLPEPDLPPESDGLLYDSRRDYLEQLERYKAYRHGDM